MASLSKHVGMELSRHSVLSYRPDCPVCRAERLAGNDDLRLVRSHRLAAALLAGTLASAGCDASNSRSRRAWSTRAHHGTRRRQSLSGKALHAAPRAPGGATPLEVPYAQRHAVEGRAHGGTRATHKARGNGARRGARSRRVGDIRAAHGDPDSHPAARRPLRGAGAAGIRGVALGAQHRSAQIERSIGARSPVGVVSMLAALVVGCLVGWSACGNFV